MKPDLLARYDRAVPRYTSYPTAPHFHAGIDAGACRRWLAEVPADTPLSLYAHVPFCQSLCWYCGCHTTAARRYQPVAEYLEVLCEEIRLVAEALGARRRPVRHVHFGGGTPTILSPEDLRRLGLILRERFEFLSDAEFAVEIDPRVLTPATVSALADIGVNRASLGVQDVNAEVQRAINRRQPLEVTERAVDSLRAAGIGAINIDLMYGLPHQTEARVVRSVEAILALGPQRVALFGYAHVPWMKRHQQLIDEAALPGAEERAAQRRAAAARLVDAGYVAVGIDHFARPDDGLAVALREGRLHRNFQGYTTDGAAALIGFGASAIGSLPQGYVQNAVPIPVWREAIRGGRLATARGIEVSREDRLRRAIIERLMCDFAVDLGRECGRFGVPPDRFSPELEALRPLQADGLVSLRNHTVRVEAEGRPLVRAVCAVFDAYLAAGKGRHSRAI
ncbi:MAG TPA: oxygen-independent coproporphyrinogen III oxidase [Geminicoccaceae bacterium]|nr:oxygen-independent coproporphyrinogen III oxidase [Geminicoccaceae bacterium]